MFWRCFVLAACVALTAGPAHAQQRVMRYTVAGPEGVPLTVGPISPTATEGEVAQMLRDALTNFDNSTITVRQGVVRQGEEFATRDMPYERVRRLANDVTRGGALGGRTLLLLAGTPLYFQPFTNTDRMFLEGSAMRRGLWCGAGVNGRDGYCLLAHRNNWEVAELRSDSPYMPIEIGPLVPASDAELTTDPNVLAELPRRTEVYRFGGMRGSRATIDRAMRIGADTIDVEDVQLERMRLGSLMVSVEAGPDPQTATVSYEALDPADFESDILMLARSILDLAD
jgi:hypothetical protein